MLKVIGNARERLSVLVFSETLFVRRGFCPLDRDINPRPRVVHPRVCGEWS